MTHGCLGMTCPFSSFFLTAVATAFSVATSAGQTAAITTAAASASSQAAAANTQAAGQALAATAIQSVTQGVTDAFAASQVRFCASLALRQCDTVGGGTLPPHLCTVQA